MFVLDCLGAAKSQRNDFMLHLKSCAAPRTEWLQDDFSFPKGWFSDSLSAFRFVLLYSCQQHLQIRCPLCRMRVPTASWAPFVDQSVYLKAELRLFEMWGPLRRRIFFSIFLKNITHMFIFTCFKGVGFLFCPWGFDDSSWCHVAGFGKWP